MTVNTIKIQKPFLRISEKTKSLNAVESENHTVLSHNKVTGWSVNFPVQSTCQPTKVCSKTCYALFGPVTWKNSLNKQKVNEYLCKDSPEIFAERVIKECVKKISRDKQFFLRWNGTGDLFPESIRAIELISSALPDLPIWLVTRIPKYAKEVILLNKTNVFVHFSLDSNSLERRASLEASLPELINKQLFFSYQCDKDEIYDPVARVSVVFANRYKSGSIDHVDESICPLNYSDDISGMCNKCRRCFNGAAVSHRELISL